MRSKRRITWQAVLADGMQSVVKAYYCAEDREFEIECYYALRPLQGRSLQSVLRRSILIAAPGPRFYYNDEPEEDPCIHGFVFSWVGPEHGVDRGGQ